VVEVDLAVRDLEEEEEVDFFGGGEGAATAGEARDVDATGCARAAACEDDDDEVVEELEAN
jgi:hypothetical protein